MNISTTELTNRLMKFCKKNELEIETIHVRKRVEEIGGFAIELDVNEGD